MESKEDGYRRGYRQLLLAGIPIGGRIPMPGKRCRFRHDRVLEEYPALRGMHGDMVCQKCGDRKILYIRPYREGEEHPDFLDQLAAVIRKSREWSKQPSPTYFEDTSKNSQAGIRGWEGRPPVVGTPHGGGRDA